MNQRCLSYILCVVGFVTTVCAHPLKTVVYQDGRFDVLGSSVKLTNCYPALDNRALTSLSIKVTESGDRKTIQYNLLHGTFNLELNSQGEVLTIKPLLTGLESVPGLVSLIHQAKVEGASKVYRTPAIISGQGGVKDWPANDARHSECHAVTGLLPSTPGHNLIITACDYKIYRPHAYCHPTHAHGGEQRLDLRIATENVAYDHLPVFFLAEHADAYEGMRSGAQAVADFMGDKNDQPQSYHWCSWYYTYYHLTAAMVSDYLKGFAIVQPPVRLQTFQIDAGYAPHVGDWLTPSHKFPQGLGPAAKEILAHNYRAGIWIAPYMVGNRSQLFADHPDWILCRNDGSPIVQLKFYGEERLWGAMDEEIYVLDTSNPAVMEHLRQIFRTLRKQGFTFFKTDFMYYGAEDSHAVRRFAPGKTSAEYQRELFELIRQEIGPESYWLGCIAPFPVMLGYVDGMRVAGDINPSWEGSTNMFDETRGAQHINNIWWQNDPDAMILRSRYSNLTDEETKSIALWIGMTGGVINTSDLFHEITQERVDLFRFLEPGATKLTSRLPFAATPREFEVLVREDSSRKSWAVYFLNRNNSRQASRFSIRELIGVESATCFNWDLDKAEPLGARDSLSIDLAPHHGKLMFLSTEGKTPNPTKLSGE